MTRWDGPGFAQFYAALHSGREAFGWQVELAEHLLETGRWPAVIDAPTGSGKTSVIDVHLFAVAAMAVDPEQFRVPRRLSIAVNRRAIVDSHDSYARQLRQTLRANASQSDALTCVSDALGALQTNPIDDRYPFGIAVLRGAVAPSSLWLDDPGECQIICATPEMWGSRLLFRPYGGSRWSAPRQAGLLAYDSALVVDEAHLSRQFTHTVRSIASQIDMAERPIGVPPLQVVEMTATPESAGTRIGIRPSELADNTASPLNARLLNPKPLNMLHEPRWPARQKQVTPVAENIATEAVRLRDATKGTVACVVNTVAMASAVATALREASAGKHPTIPAPESQGAVEVLVGRMRPHDVHELARRHPGLLTLDGAPEVAFLVATQTVEVGLDADFTAMVTELAPASALAQRAGRVNRIGARATGPVSIMVPADTSLTVPDSPPYSSGDLTEAARWLTTLVNDPEGINALALEHQPPPASELPRPALQSVGPWDALHLANTSIDQFSDPDLALWLEDDLREELDIEVVVRRGVTDDFAATSELLRSTPPLRHEPYKVQLPRARAFLEDRASEGIAGAVLRADDVLPLAQQGEAVRLRPGDVVVLSEDEEAFANGVFDPESPIRECTSDVYEAADRDLSVAGRRVRIGSGLNDLGRSLTIDEDLADLIAGDDEGLPRTMRFVATLSAWLPAGDGGAALLLSALLATDPRRLEITTAPAGASPTWLVIANTERVRPDEETRQTWSTSQRVLLDDHSQAVADRAQELSSQVRLDRDLISSVSQAGLYHDAGKVDPRFQAALDNSQKGAPPLAKSGMRSSTRAKQAWASTGLAGWRHEQLSAVIAQGRCEHPLDDGAPPDAELVVRLVGTSHGRGRPTFDHTAGQLLPQGPVPQPSPDAEDLFDVGTWECLIEATHRRYGVWGCAYLEALVRAADAQVSGEGR